MQAVSFRLPEESLERLKTTVEYTKWIQQVVLSQMGLCPCCGQSLPEVVDEKPSLSDFLVSSMDEKGI